MNPTTAQPPTSAKKIIDTTIDYSPDYDVFMEKLIAFHERQGSSSSLQREPVLGSKKLDLKKIYDLVVSYGGCHQVTTDRNWRTICLPFNFPATCTNSAFVMRQVYERNLEQYEQEAHWGKEVVPLPKFQRQSTASPQRGIKQTSPSNSTVPVAIAPAPSRTEESRKENTAPAPTVGPPVNKKPRLMETPPVMQTIKPISYHQYNVPPNVLPPRQSVYEEEHFLDGGPKNRMLLALKSGLPNEIDWAFNRLVKLSFACHDSFHLDMIPGLLDTLLGFANPYFQIDVPAHPVKASVPSKDPPQECILERQEGTTEWTDGNGSKLPATSGSTVVEKSTCSNILTGQEINEFFPLLTTSVDTSHTFFFEAFDSRETHERRERAIQVCHIIRNFSFLDSNAKLLASHKDLRHLLLCGLGLAAGSHHLEIRHPCLDIVENLSPYIIFRNKLDPLHLRLKSLIHDMDRALVLAAVRSLTRLTMNDANEHFIISLPPSVIRRLLQLLLVWDEDLVSAVLDFFYQFSSLTTVDSAAHIARHAPGNVVRILIKFLSWKVTARPPMPATEAQHHQPGPPALPQLPTPPLYRENAVPTTSNFELTPRNRQLRSSGPGGGTYTNASFNGQPSFDALPASVKAPTLTIPHYNTPPQELVKLPEPLRALQWLRYAYELIPGSEVPHSTIYFHYANFFDPPPHTLLTSVELIKVVKVAFAGSHDIADRGVISGIQHRPGTVPPHVAMKIVAAQAQASFAASSGDQYRNVGNTESPTPSAVARPAIYASAQIQQPMSPYGSPGVQPQLPRLPASQLSQTMVTVKADNANGNANHAASSPALSQSTQPPHPPLATTDPEAPTTGNDSSVENPAEEDRMDVDVPRNARCKWNDCSESFENEETLRDHVLSQHFSPDLLIYHCNWCGCGKFTAQGGTQNRRTAVAHFNTHRPLVMAEEGKTEPDARSTTFSISTTRSASLASTSKQTGYPPVSQHYHLPPKHQHGLMSYADEIVGIPLTTALVLRNLARSKKCQALFLPYETELTTLMTLNSRLAKAVGAILAELKLFK